MTPKTLRLASSIKYLVSHDYDYLQEKGPSYA